MIQDDAIAYTAPDYLERFDLPCDREAILALRQERQAKLWMPQTVHYREAIASVGELQSDRFDFAEAVVKIGEASELSPDQRQRWYRALQTFCPWKKGPFELFGVEIDAEWRSDWKWARIVPQIQPLRDRRVADIGCHNGYYLFRIAHHQPACVIGFEPVAKHFWNFQLLQNVVRQDRLSFELLGVEHLHFYPNCFDTIFCLGILYHHPDPIGLLVKLRQALSPEGEIIIDCQGIPGDQPVALMPRKRYAQARGIWFLPTQSCLETWIARAGLSQIHCFFAAPLSTEEQRRTVWADVDSLAEFLDPNQRDLTVEGYPAPWRYYVVARK